MTTLWRKSAHGVPAYGHMVSGGFQVEIGIWPVALGHKTGVVWTPDQWHSVNWTEAQWSYNATNNYGSYDEVWTAVIDFKASHPVSFWYALYLVDTYGNWYWDNNNGWNYVTQSP
jgi:hypothetical protein